MWFSIILVRPSPAALFYFILFFRCPFFSFLYHVILFYLWCVVCVCVPWAGYFVGVFGGGDTSRCPLRASLPSALPWPPEEAARWRPIFRSQCKPRAIAFARSTATHILLLYNCTLCPSSWRYLGFPSIHRVCGGRDRVICSPCHFF